MGIILTILISIFCLASSYSQNIKGEYKKAKVTLSTGQVLSAKKLKFENNQAFFKYTAPTGKTIDLNYDYSEIQDIQVVSKRNSLPGFFIGAGVGIITMLILEKRIEKPKYQQVTVGSVNFYPYSVPIYGEIDVSRKMYPGPKLVIVSGASLLGLLVGSSIKKTWKTILPNKATLINNIDLNFDLGYNNNQLKGLNLKYNF